ncbi:hypothetical protein GOB86_10355 [Acetobacter lambici]|uniref:Uncharacterized protein n=1 Tax=Acetobacter lambici TaxID=1332824 RepID=A0ABT1F195_9PROT|nr:hypothetical protein [Acetobacter lambici]MCP1242800.1 hypothetical protein [Acetobacter lambici]MCP1258970.1 hypothetical protein [Acetobacter lambici]NHO57450.1 hypothetical protein [Acetobacter lambici]
MIIIIPEQGQSITIHPGQQSVVILSPKPSSEAVVSAPSPWPDTNVALKTEGTRATRLARRIAPVIILSAFAFLGALYLNPAHKTAPIETLDIQKSGQAHSQLRPVMPAPMDLPQKQAMRPPTEENPNSAFGLN